MKKNMIFAAALAALVSLGACSGDKDHGKCHGKDKGECAKKECCKKADKTYTGVLPAADAYGVRYTLTLDFDEKNGGDYDLVQTYFNIDSTGVVDVASFVSEGDFTTGKTAAGVDYINLKGKGADEMYFVAEGDSAIVMTDATYTPAATPGVNYTLKAAK